MNISDPVPYRDSLAMTSLSVPGDILRVIFQMIQAMHITVNGLHPHVVLSHVSKRWRLLALNSPVLWSDILITRKTRTDVLRIFLERSGCHGLDVNILHLPSHHRLIVPSIRRTISFVGLHAQRWKHLRVRGDAVALSNIMPFLLRFSFTELQSFEVVQTEPSSVLHFGPFRFNPSSLITVRLQAVTIHVVDPSHLAGVEVLDLDATSCQCMLDQSCMDTLSNAASFSERHRPSMACLRRLSISAIIFYFPAHPSFDPSSLVSLRLGGMRGLSPASIQDFIRLLHELSGPSLEDLELDGVVGFAWEAFILSLHAANDAPRYPNVRTITFRSLILGNLDMNFVREFPNIIRLMLFDVNPQPLHFLVQHHPGLWPTLLILIDPK